MISLTYPPSEVLSTQKHLTVYCCLGWGRELNELLSPLLTLKVEEEKKGFNVHCNLFTWTNNSFMRQIPTGDYHRTIAGSFRVGSRGPLHWEFLVDFSPLLWSCGWGTCGPQSPSQLSIHFFQLDGNIFCCSLGSSGGPLLIDAQSSDLRPFYSRGTSWGFSLGPTYQQTFNYCLSPAWPVVKKNASGILSSQWRIYRWATEVHKEAVEMCSRAICVLNNFLRRTTENACP